MFDGTLARATGKVSKLGAFMDSVFDRWGEGVVYVGIVVGALDVGSSMRPVLAAAAMGAAFMVSYTRAKSEGLGFTPGTGMAAVGVMPREVRLVILTLGLILGLDRGPPGVADRRRRWRRDPRSAHRHPAARPGHHRRRRHHHRHPADPPRPQPGQSSTTTTSSDCRQHGEAT